MRVAALVVCSLMHEGFAISDRGPRGAEKKRVMRARSGYMGVFAGLSFSLGVSSNNSNNFTVFVRDRFLCTFPRILNRIFRTIPIVH